MAVLVLERKKVRQVRELVGPELLPDEEIELITAAERGDPILAAGLISFALSAAMFAVAPGVVAYELPLPPRFFVVLTSQRLLLLRMKMTTAKPEPGIVSYLWRNRIVVIEAKGWFGVGRLVLVERETGESATFDFPVSVRADGAALAKALGC